MRWKASRTDSIPRKTQSDIIQLSESIVLSPAQPSEFFMNELIGQISRPMVSQMAYENYLANLTPIDIKAANDLHEAMFDHLSFTVFTNPVRDVETPSEWHIVGYDDDVRHALFELFALAVGYYLSPHPMLIERFHFPNKSTFTVKGQPHLKKEAVTIQQALAKAKVAIRDRIEKKLTAHRAMIVGLQNSLVEITDVNF